MGQYTETSVKVITINEKLPFVQLALCGSPNGLLRVFLNIHFLLFTLQNLPEPQ